MTPEQKHTLEHDVHDADAWDAHQRAHFIAKHGEKEGTRIANANLLAKVKRIEEKTDYLRVKDSPGYKNRVVRQADEDAEQQAKIYTQLAAIQQEKERQAAEFDAAVEAKVAEILNRNSVGGSK